MSVWTTYPDTTPLGTAYASYFISFTAMGTAPLIMAWLADLLPQDPEARSLVIGVAIASYYAISAWSQVLVWPAVQAPYCELHTGNGGLVYRDADYVQTNTAGSRPLPWAFWSSS